MKRCVYTALTGGYEPLNEQIVARESTLPFICFTDDPATACDGWEIRPLQPVFPADDIRNQRAYKLQPHLLLAEFDQSLYIDNSVLLRLPPEQIFEAVDLAAGMALPVHSFRESLRDEFAIIAEEKIDDPRRVAEQLQHYEAAFPQVLAGPVCWGGLMLRDHHAPKVQAAMEIWLAHVYRYSRRDQLSSAVAFHVAGLQPEILTLDNYESEFHTWPNLTGRKAERRLWNGETPETLALRRENAELLQTLEALQREHFSLTQTHAGLQQAHLELGQRHDGLQQAQLELQQRFDGLQHAQRELQQNFNTLQHAHLELTRTHASLQQERDWLLRSTSWRVTAPLRAIKEKAGRFLG
jgi:hypothetical protein